jgi:hypothetical protein
LFYSHINLISFSILNAGEISLILTIAARFFPASWNFTDPNQDKARFMPDHFNDSNLLSHSHHDQRFILYFPRNIFPGAKKHPSRQR